MDDISENRVDDLTIIGCASCGRIAAVPIVYGMPVGWVVEMSQLGGVSLGGCMVSDDDYEWECHRCGTTFGAPSEIDPRKVVAAFVRAFDANFAQWKIALPEIANALRLPGVTERHEMHVRWAFGRDGSGREMLDVYAADARGAGRAFRVTEDGETTELQTEDGVALDEDVRMFLRTRDIGFLGGRARDLDVER